MTATLLAIDKENKVRIDRFDSAMSAVRKLDETFERKRHSSDLLAQEVEKNKIEKQFLKNNEIEYWWPMQ